MQGLQTRVSIKIVRVPIHKVSVNTCELVGSVPPYRTAAFITAVMQITGINGDHGGKRYGCLPVAKHQRLNLAC